MNSTQYAGKKLHEAQARAQGPDEGERAIGNALVEYWTYVLKQYSHGIGPRVHWQGRSGDDAQLADDCSMN